MSAYAFEVFSSMLDLLNFVWVGECGSGGVKD